MKIVFAVLNFQVQSNDGIVKSNDAFAIMNAYVTVKPVLAKLKRVYIGFKFYIITKSLSRLKSPSQPSHDDCAKTRFDGTC
ncbi:MAG: hypothetical protein Salg2KO_11340 [Salibacteraceae bacterium]